MGVAFPAGTMPAVHQFSPSCDVGDGTTNGMLFTRALLRELGIESEIYCGHVAPALADQIRPMADYPDRPGDLLLFHHAFGHGHDAWVAALRSRLVLAYHNITPEQYFPAGSADRRHARLGRDQLARMRDRCELAIGMSPYNSAELLTVGYDRVATLPLLVDLDRIRAGACNAPLLAALRAAPPVLFVGRLSEHKCQHDIVEVFDHYRRLARTPVTAALPGGAASASYRTRLLEMIAERGLTDQVALPGKVAAADLGALYRGARCFVSMSEHEGFGMPLIEAMAFDLPVIAFDSSNIAETLGGAGILVGGKDHRAIAGLLALLDDEPGLRSRIVRAQRQNLARFERAEIRRRLAGLLADLGLPVDRPDAAAMAPAPPSCLIEGPFDSSYSLAAVNRHLAAALDRRGVSLGLRFADGGRDLPPDRSFLTANPRLAALSAAGDRAAGATIVLRNQYPPAVDGMDGLVKGLMSHAWEETAVAPERVAAFNRTLDLVTVTSRWVRKVLVDNGVHVPISVVGNGIDHILAIEPEPYPGYLGPDGVFRFLHVSSGFPRKGLDALLDAWGRAFSAADAVCLIVKTFPNPHNTAALDLAALAARHPGHAPIVLIDRDLGEGQLLDLYRRCDALVAPSRGEGFGLPLAEAMALGMPVIATGHGGQRDFATPETAWLVDFRFAWSKSHLGLFHSVWVDPDPDDLVRALRALRSADAATVAQRTAAARELVLSRYRWDDVAGRTLAAIAAAEQATLSPELPRLGWVGTWNSRCGIATYAQSLSCALPPSSLSVFADRDAVPLGDDPPFVRRCWSKGEADPLDELFDALVATGARAVVIQFSFGFFALPALARLLDRLGEQRIFTLVTLHSTQDVVQATGVTSLASIAPALRRAGRVLVHGIADLNRLKDFGIVDNATLFPHGVPAPLDAPAPAREALGLGDRRVIASFGFLLPHKGLAELLGAFEQLRDGDDRLHLLLVNALYPVPESEAEHAALRQRIAGSRHGGAVTLVTDFLPEAEAQRLLMGAEVVVFPYQRTQESASGAVRLGLASGRPVAVTPLPIFDDVAPVATVLPGTDAVSIAAGIGAMLKDRPHLDALAARQYDWLAAHAWDLLGRRLCSLIRAEVADAERARPEISW